MVFSLSSGRGKQKSRVPKEAQGRPIFRPGDAGEGQAPPTRYQLIRAMMTQALKKPKSFFSAQRQIGAQREKCPKTDRTEV